MKLKEFTICRSSDMRRFGSPNAKTSDPIRVVLAGDLTIDVTMPEIGVGGIVRVDNDATGNTPYYIDASYLQH